MPRLTTEELRMSDGNQVRLHKLNRRVWMQATIATGTGLASQLWLPPLAAQQAAAKNSGLIVLSQSPLNAEPPLEKLVASHITPVEHFYVRNHGPIPDAKASNGVVSIDGLVEKPGKLSLAEIK